MSYRSFKHLLGETSLERKCRFIFGGGILVLVSFSFYWYGQKTESLVINQTTQAARMLVNPIVMNIHYKSMGNEDFASVMEVLWGDLEPLDELPELRGPHPQPVQAARTPSQQPGDDFEQAALDRFLRAAAAEAASPRPGRPASPYTFADGTPMWEWRSLTSRKDKKEYQYIQAVLLQAGLPDGLPRRPELEHRQEPHDARSGRTASGSWPRRATWPARSWSTCRWSRRPRRSTATARS